MNKLILLLAICAFSLTTFATGDPPDWANKKGGIGIGPVTNLSVFNSNYPRGNYMYKQSNAGIGVHGRYNLFDFLYLDGILGYSSMKVKYEDEDDDFDNTFQNGFVGGLRVGAPLVGRGSLCTPECNSPVSVSPYLGTTLTSGTSTWESEYGGFEYDESEPFKQLNFNLGLQFEYFINLGNVNLSSFVSCNLAGINNMTYDDSDYRDLNSKSTHFFGTSALFGNAGFTVWFK